jgi:hypothetical protein
MRPAVVAGLLLLVVIVLEFYSVWRALLIAIHNGCFTSIPAGRNAQIVVVRRRLGERVISTPCCPSRSAPLRAENTGKQA